MEHRRNQENGSRIEAAHRNPDLVFCDGDGDYYKPDQMSSRIAEIARRLGRPGIGLHSMRHTHASQLLSRGVPIPTVSNASASRGRISSAADAFSFKL
jgi:integrase